MGKIFGMSMLGAVVVATFAVFGGAQQPPVARIANIGPLSTGVALAGDAGCAAEGCVEEISVD